MGMLLAFALFIVFAVITTFTGATAGLGSGAAVAATLFARDILMPGRQVKMLEAGTLVLFGAMAAYALVANPAWSVMAVRMRIDGGLLAIVLVTLAVGRPFTLQYARAQVAPELWGSAAFVRTNYVITAVWALAFAVMTAAEFALVYVPAVPHRVGVIAVVMALVGAFKFTSWYPEQVRRAAAG